MMTRHRALTPRQRAFADAVHAGATLSEAARQAGYSARSARQTGSRLMRHPAIIEAIERRQQGYSGQPPASGDPREFLLWVMNGPEVFGLRERVEVAAFLLPFCHPRR